MFNKHIKLFCLILTLLQFVFPLNGSAESHKRDSWYIGFGIGGGIDASYTLNGKDITFDDWIKGAEEKNPEIAINFKVGSTLSPKTLIGFDVTAVGQTGKLDGEDVQIQINNYFLMLTHFPLEEGFFIRGGGGFSNIMFITPIGNEVVSGYGILGGVGYAFWLGKSFNLTLNLDHSRQFYSTGTNEPDKSQFTIGYIGFDWY